VPFVLLWLKICSVCADFSCNLTLVPHGDASERRRISPLRRNDNAQIFARTNTVVSIVCFTLLAFFAVKFRIRIWSHDVTFVPLVVTSA